MSKGQLQLAGAIIIASITMVGSLGTAWVSGSQAANEKLNTTKIETAQAINNEKLERTNADIVLNGQLEKINDKLDAIINGLGIKYQLTK